MIEDFMKKNDIRRYTEQDIRERLYQHSSSYRKLKGEDLSKLFLKNKPVTEKKDKG